MRAQVPQRRKCVKEEWESAGDLTRERIESEMREQIPARRIRKA